MLAKELHLNLKSIEQCKQICKKEGWDWDNCKPSRFNNGFFRDWDAYLYKELESIHNDCWKLRLPDLKSTYGVADNLNQIKGYFKQEIEDKDNTYVIGLIRVDQNKNNAGQCDGWRWHKWGPYIGKLNPKCEYLDDEDFGKNFQGFVLCFQLYKIKNYE